MADLILHHYPNSPFSEKVRLVFGMKGMAWQSVMVPAINPKPDVVALTGGYRRTPFMQIGADVYCDTALMCRVIDQLQPTPPLYPEATAGLAEIVAQWADTALFWSAVPFTMQPAAIGHVLAGATPEMLKVFGADRAAMNPNFKRPTSTDGAAHVQTQLARLEALLADGRPFLLGAVPCIADFSAAQSVWFIRLAPPIATVLEPFTKVCAWYARIQAFGHGQPEKMTSAQAIEAAASSTPAATSFEAEPGLAQGDEVTITPTDYAHDPVAGQLVGLSREEAVIARTDERAGRVQVHFPRLAFQIKKTQPA